MLRRSNPISEVAMFSLIALYFDYRKLRAARASSATIAAAPRAAVANDTASNRVIATAA